MVIAIGSGIRVSAERTAARASTGCPRCDTALAPGPYEMECLMCGYADYESTTLTVSHSRRSIVSSGTIYSVRYGGDAKTLCEVLTYVEVIGGRGRGAYRVACPFDKTLMVQTSLSGKRREKREERYGCDKGHRISLTPDKSGSLSWK